MSPIRASFRAARRNRSDRGYAAIVPTPSDEPVRYTEIRALPIRAGQLAAQRRLAERAVHRQPLPLDPVLFVVCEQPLPPELQEHTGLGPLTEAPIRPRATTDPGRSERVPLHPRPQHEQDRVHRLPVRNARPMTTQRVRWRLRHERLHPRPHPIRDPPTRATNLQSQTAPPLRP